MGRFTETARPAAYVLQPSSYSALLRLSPPVLAWGSIQTRGRKMAGKSANTKSIRKRRGGGIISTPVYRSLAYMSKRNTRRTYPLPPDPVARNVGKMYIPEFTYYSGLYSAAYWCQFPRISAVSVRRKATVSLRNRYRHQPAYVKTIINARPVDLRFWPREASSSRHTESIA